MTIRSSIGNSIRFKVFKRDLFVCQYCGATPPSVVLEVDHIHPVSKGGKNGIDNLVTSCFSCNRGKGANTLDDIPKSLSDRAAEIAEREAQLKGYGKIIKSKAKRVTRDAWAVVAALEGVECVESYGSMELSSIRRFLDDLHVSEVIEAAEIARTKWSYKTNNTFKYFCGICWKKIRDRGNG